MTEKGAHHQYPSSLGAVGAVGPFREMGLGERQSWHSDSANNAEGTEGIKTSGHLVRVREVFNQ